MGRREEALDSALALLAEQGARGLTHRAVDQHGGLPPGTTSNHFRTRDALLAGTLDHLADRELALVGAFDAAAAADPTGPEQLVGEIAAIIDHLLGPARLQTLARHAIFLEAAWRPSLQAPLTRTTSAFWRVLADRLAAVGAPAPVPGARTMLACVDGIILDQLIRPQADFDAAAALRPIVLGVVRAAEPPAH